MSQSRSRRRLHTRPEHDRFGNVVPRLLLPTRDSILTLREVLCSNELWAELVDEDLLFDCLFEHLGREQEAELMLPVFAYEVGDVFMNSGASPLHPHLLRFGQELYTILQDLGAYREGYLCYLYDQMWGNDMMVFEDYAILEL